MFGGPRHQGPSSNQPQAPPQHQFLGPNALATVNESLDRIKKEFEALQSINHRITLDMEQLRNEKHETDKQATLYSEMSYGLHLEMCKEREIVKRLTNIIMSILQYLSNEQQVPILNSLERAKQISPEDINNILAEQMRESAWTNGFLNPNLNQSLSALQYRRPLSGSSGLPGLPHGLPPGAPPMHLPQNLPPHSLPPHGPSLHGLPPGAFPPGMNLSSPPAGLLAMTGVPGAPNFGAGLLGHAGGLLPPHTLKNDQVPGSSKNLPINDANNSSNNHMNSINNAFSSSNNNNNSSKQPRGSIDSERRAASGSSISSDKEHRDAHNSNQSNDTKHHVSKKHRRDESSSIAQHSTISNTQPISDDEKSEDLVVDGNDDRASPNSHFNGSMSPRENGSGDWNQSKVKKERPQSRASSINSGPSMKERASPSTKSGSSKSKLSPNQINLGSLNPEALGGPLGPNPLLASMANFGRNVYMNPLGPDMRQLAPNPFGMPPYGPPPNELCSIQLDSDGSQKYIPCSPRALADPLVPKRAREVCNVLNNGEVVCAVALSNPTKHIYTGGRGFVKIWSLNTQNISEHHQPETYTTPVTEIKCLLEKHYVRSCKLLPDGKKLVVGGEIPPISVWDLSCGGTPKKIGELEDFTHACYAMAVSPDSKICITCSSDGTIGIYDLHNIKLIGKFKGHNDGVSCIDISGDGNTLWTGGLDQVLKAWNLTSTRTQIEPSDYVSKADFSSQIFSLACDPSGNHVAVGMENSIIEIMDTNKQDRMKLKTHDSCVLALKFATSGKWFISTGKDKIVNLCGSPSINCPLIMKSQENSSILSCDISADDKYFATGSGEGKATIYEVIY